MIKKSDEEITYVDCKNKIPLDIDEGSFVSIDRSTPLKIYSLGFQPAKSIPEIPDWFLNKYIARDSIIFEPFAGSGTTLIASLKHGSSIFWMDNHPLSQLNCRVKTMSFDTELLMEQLKLVLKKSKKQETVLITTKFRNRDFWFQKDVQEGLQILKNNINKINSPAKSVLLIAFANTVRKCSDMDDGMILASRRAGNREIPKYSRQDVFCYFESYAKKAIEAVTEWNNVVPNPEMYSKEIATHDARILEGDWMCDAVITSPPYINAIDYVWASKFELHWLDLVKSDSKRLELYSNEIGTERIPSDIYKEIGITGHKYLDKLVEDIYYGKKYKATKGQNELRARVVYKYFMDMKKHFEVTFPHIRQDGYYCFTIGDASNICGVEIPVATILTDIAEKIGYKKIFHFNLLLKNRQLNVPRNVSFAGIIEHDTTVILQK
ncbi:hypothetical protein [Tissierella praeacuta]|uniref:hypothetical protein n=1 Tax=Tissierella praeacuta TaxID=43131 RepID=UPI002FD90ABD